MMGVRAGRTFFLNESTRRVWNLEGVRSTVEGTLASSIPLSEGVSVRVAMQVVRMCSEDSGFNVGEGVGARKVVVEGIKDSAPIVDEPEVTEGVDLVLQIAQYLERTSSLTHFTEWSHISNGSLGEKMQPVLQIRGPYASSRKTVPQKLGPLEHSS